MKEKEIRDLVEAEIDTLRGQMREIISDRNGDIMDLRDRINILPETIKSRDADIIDLNNRIIDLSKRTEERFDKLGEEVDCIQSYIIAQIFHGRPDSIKIKQEPKTKTYVCENCQNTCRLVINGGCNPHKYPSECPLDPQSTEHEWRLKDE